MTQRAHLLATGIEEAMPLFERFLQGFGDDNRTAQAPNLPNHAAWTLGHLALYARRTGDRVEGHDDPRGLPGADFVTGDGRAGDAAQYDTESVCIGSVPVDDPAMYPAWDRCMQVYRGAHARLIEAVRGAGDDLLDRAIPWGSSSLTGEQIARRMACHLCTHAGQIADLRRALGMARVIG